MQGKLARYGMGGRGDPFSYQATASGLDALQDIIINQTLQNHPPPTTHRQLPTHPPTHLS